MYLPIENQSSMLDKIKRIFSKPELVEETLEDDDLFGYENPNFLTDPDQIFKLLCDIEISSPLCTIQIEGSNQDYSSSILSVKADKCTFTIDELTPHSGNALLQRSKAFKLLVFHKGIHLSFNAIGVEIGFARGISFYKAAIPDRVFYPQRRRAPRMEIRAIDIPFSGVAQKTGLSVSGYLYDLSRGGAGIELPLGRTRLLRGDIINRCQMTFEDYVMDFSLNVRFIKPALVGVNKMQIGGMFENVSAKSATKLSHFITSLERYEIRKQKA